MIPADLTPSSSLSSPFPLSLSNSLSVPLALFPDLLTSLSLSLSHCLCLSLRFTIEFLSDDSSLLSSPQRVRSRSSAGGTPPLSPNKTRSLGSVDSPTPLTKPSSPISGTAKQLSSPRRTLPKAQQPPRCGVLYLVTPPPPPPPLPLDDSAPLSHRWISQGQSRFVSPTPVVNVSKRVVGSTNRSSL
jgi:hypothetical protein